jgi:propionaldehyde dehydrogenase
MDENTQGRQAPVVDAAVCASLHSFEQYRAQSLNTRREIISALRLQLRPYLRELAEREWEETHMGNVRDKVIKLVLALDKTPGVEDLPTEVVTGDNGMTLHERTPYGVTAALFPATNPCATMINNVISLLAAGNTVIGVPDPRCMETSLYLSDKINEIIRNTAHIDALLVTLPEARSEVVRELIDHPDVALVVATGGRRLMRLALGSPKRVIAGGPANPVAIVDETADLQKAARDIVDGASFDQNIMCISEKCIVAVDSIVPALMRRLEDNGAYCVEGEAEVARLCDTVLNHDKKMLRKMEGKSAEEILEAAGITPQHPTRLIVVRTDERHPLVLEECLMPVVPLVSARDFESALEMAQFVEQGYRHTATFHSQRIDRLNRAAKAMDVTLFIKNGSSLAGIGLNGEEKASFTVANITGEGMVTARDLTRKRSCTLTDGFSIR